jgi:hypothetical protein
MALGLACEGKVEGVVMYLMDKPPYNDDFEAVKRVYQSFLGRTGRRPEADGLGEAREVRANGARRRGQHHRTPLPLGDTHLNVKRLVALMAGWTRETGMMKAMKRLAPEATPSSTHHRGPNDSVEIARMPGMAMAGRPDAGAGARGGSQHALR